MIFVTVGTHEQQFDRLIKYIDGLKKEKIIKEEVIMQTGFCTYEPRFCKYKKLIPYSEMISNIFNARIIITHGGPASFIMPLQIGKIPIVVPRQFDYDEHVNNHQVEFSKLVKERMNNIIPIYEINDLKETIFNYDSIVKKMRCELNSNNDKFIKNLENEIEELFRG